MEQPPEAQISFDTARLDLKPIPPPKPGRPPVRQRSANELSSGPSLRFMPPVLKRGGSSVRRGEGVGSYFPPLQIGALVLHASVACNRARRYSRSAAAIF